MADHPTLTGNALICNPACPCGSAAVTRANEWTAPQRKVTVRTLKRNRTFCEGDNIEFLLRMGDEYVDLIATDPPFNKDRKFQGINQAEGASFKDYWQWDSDDDVHPAYLAHVKQHRPELGEVIEAAYAAHSPSMAAFLAFMSVRLSEMHRILKPTGTLYLHCDPTANAYLRLMLDSIFGPKNFIDEVVWNYGTPSGGRTAGKKPVKVHDTLLVYAKSYGEHTYNIKHTPYNERYVKEWFRHTNERGRKYRTRKRGGEIVRQYLDESPGVPLSNVWNDIMQLYGSAGWFPGTAGKKERQGWPTQKPVELYKRIIELSSNEGDLVLDPFAGCATTCVAAEQAGRKWIGVDLSPLAMGITLKRLREAAGRGSFWEKNVHYVKLEDLPPLKGGIVSHLSIPNLPERGRRGRRFKPQDVRGYLSAREAVGMDPKQDYNQTCQGCGYTPPRLEYLDVDHLLARKARGDDDSANLCLLCGPCNRKKNHKLTIDQLR